jgi:hypothetical protein
MRPYRQPTTIPTRPAGVPTGASRRSRRALLLPLALCALGGWSQAQTSISGTIHDGSGGPLVSGTVYVVTGSITVPAGETLTIPSDVIVKFHQTRSFTVDGTLTVTGTASEPVAFTAFTDDDWGGDSNGDGPSSGSRNYWKGLSFSSTASASTIENAVVRWSGEGFWGALDITDADITVTDCSFLQNGQSAIDLNGSGARPTVTGCSFVDNSGYVCTAMPLEAAAGFTGCTASGNGGNHLNITSPSPTADLTLTADNCVGGALRLVGSPTIAAGITLTLDEGVVIKMQNGGMVMNVEGTLLVEATPDNPVVFTAYHDDEYGGDTNGDGASSGWLNYWSGITFASTSGDSVLEHAVVRYGGYNYTDAITIAGADIILRGCVLERNGQDGLGLADTPSHPRVEWCSFIDNGRRAVTDTPIEAVPGFLFNRASGNAESDCVHITSTSPGEDVVLRHRNMISGALMFASHTTVPADVALSIEAGVVIKVVQAGSSGFEVHGSLNVRGTAEEPVVITSYRDDEYGGDSNGDGPSTGGWIDWSGIKFHSDAQTSIMEHAVVRYNGRAYWNAIDVASPNVTLRSVLSEQSYTRGFSISALAGNAENLVARSCQYAGIQATGGDFDIVNATVVYCGTGIEKSGSHTGMARNCISWDNTTNYSGFGVGELQSSDGSAAHDGTGGCINLDPQFVDAPGGDYHLQLTSPCIDSADLAVALPLISDHDENSRILDPHLTGTMLPDMGAHEYALWTMSVRGMPALGGLMRFEVDGPAGTSIYMLGLQDGSVTDAPFGIIAAGNASLMTFATVNVGQPYALEIPRLPSLIGVEFAVQTRTFPTGSTTVGGITNCYRDHVRPSIEIPLRQKR